MSIFIESKRKEKEELLSSSFGRLGSQGGHLVLVRQTSPARPSSRWLPGLPSSLGPPLLFSYSFLKLAGLSSAVFILWDGNHLAYEWFEVSFFFFFFFCIRLNPGGNILPPSFAISPKALFLWGSWSKRKHIIHHGTFDRCKWLY